MLFILSGSFCQRKNGCAEMEETLGANLCVENQGDCYVDTDSLPKCK
jgi:hypothetical protein